MKVGVLFSGGKDSTYVAYLAKQAGNEIACLINIISENKFSYMFHTPSITMTAKQAEVMGVPLLVFKTKGEKEKELSDLKDAIKEAVKKYGIEGIVTGALASDYQASRISKICEELKLKCINPLWKKNQIELLEELLKNKFEVVVIGVAAYPLDEKWLGRKIDRKFILQVSELQKKYGINPAGEGGEFETFVLNCPMFSKPLRIIEKKIHKFGENSWHMEIKVK
jgi:ABC transporter with metal-binding/Fe-S-binding domain ATP-binding protein